MIRLAIGRLRCSFTTRGDHQCLGIYIWKANLAIPSRVGAVEPRVKEDIEVTPAVHRLDIINPGLSAYPLC
jgi:hypothetical protein